MDFLQIVMTPFSLLMKGLYFLLFENYGLTLIVFALIVKVVLFPFSIKGKKGMIQMNMLQGKMQQIQKKYATDKERQNLEIQKLYEKEHVNPMGGCLWTMIPMFVLLPLYAVVRRPLRYLMGLNDTVIASITATATAGGVALNAGYPEISIVNAFHGSAELMNSASAAAGGVDLFGMNFGFLGIDLAATPVLKFWENGLSWATIGLFLIPIISAVMSFVSSKIMMKTNNMNSQPQEGTAASTNKMMMWMTPLMSLYIGFIMPAGLGIYWIANSVFSMAQEMIAGKILKKDYEAAAATRAEHDRLEKEEEKQHRREAAERKALAIAEGKKGKGKKPAASTEEKKVDATLRQASTVGMRAYARGRAYDPARFNPDGPTSYHEPGAPVDETVLDQALEKKSDHLGELALEVAADDAIIENLMEENGPAEETWAPAEQDPWAELDQEIAAIQNAPDEDEEETKE